MVRGCGELLAPQPAPHLPLLLRPGSAEAAWLEMDGAGEEAFNPCKKC